MENNNNPAILYDLENQDDTFDGKKMSVERCNEPTMSMTEDNNMNYPDRERTLSMCSGCQPNDLGSLHGTLSREVFRVRCNSQTVILQDESNVIKSKKGTISNSRNDNKRIDKWKAFFHRRSAKEEKHQVGPRAFGKRSSVENFGLIGLLTPALVLLPKANGADALTGQFADLKGEHRELKLAAAHIEDALSGRGKYGKARSFFKSKFAQRCFRTLHNIWYCRIFLAVIIIHAVLVFLEPPSVNQMEVNFAVYVIGGMCIALYIFDIFIRVQFFTWRIFWSLKTVEGYWNGVQFVLVCLFMIDFSILILTRCIDVYIPQPFRCLRLTMLLCKVKSIRHIFAVLTTIGTRLLKVFFIILVFIVIFASIGVHLYMDVYNTVHLKSNTTNSSRSLGSMASFGCFIIDKIIEESEKVSLSVIIFMPWGDDLRTSHCCCSPCCILQGSDEDTYIGTFDNIGNAMLRLFVLLSTENYPEIMLPALRKNSVNFLFFGVFLFVGIFLLAILLAIVVDSYWLFAKKHVKKERAKERAELAKAWNLLDPLGLGSLSVYDEQFRDLFRILKPKNSDDQNQMLIELLDSNLDGEIDSFEWTTLLRQALQAEFEEDPDDDDSEYESDKTTARLKESARKIVESTPFSKTMLCLIFLHCALFAVRWKGQPSDVEITIQGIRTCIVIIFMFEAILRITALGKAVFHTLEITDLILVLLSLLFNVLWFPVFSSFAHREYSVTVSSIAVFFRLFLNSAETRKGFYWFLNIAPVMVDLMILLFVIMYLLSAIGMELFHTYPLSESSQIYPDNCGLGFKTFYCSFLVQFQMLTTSNWHEIMNMVEKETQSKASYLYFCVSYILITMTVMNLFTAIAIEAANKLALSHEEQKVHSNHEQKKKPKERAKKALNTLAEKLFASARVEDIHHRERRSSLVLSNATVTGTKSGSNTIILQSPRKSPSSVKRVSSALDNERTFTAAQMEEFFTSESSDSEEEDYTGLGPKEKRERQLKRRMRRKRRERRHRERDEYEAEERTRTRSPWFDLKEEVRVVTAFKGSRDTDLPLTVGDTVVILEKNDEWLRGESKGKSGWFPASHVASWTAKSCLAVAETAVISNEMVVEEQASVLQKYTPEEIVYVREDDLQVGQTDPPYLEKQLSPLPIHLQPLSPPRHRLKMKKAGDWTRNILGDITVMNADEMRELNKVMRAEMKAPLLVGRGRNRHQMGYLGSASNLSQRDHNVLMEEQGEVDSLHDGVRVRSDTLESQRRPLTGATDSLSRIHVDTSESNARQGSGGSSASGLAAQPKQVKSPFRPLSASQPSRPVTPTHGRESSSRPRAPTSSSTSSAEVASSPSPKVASSPSPKGASSPSPKVASSPSPKVAVFENDSSNDNLPSDAGQQDNEKFVVSVDTGTPTPPSTMLESEAQHETTGSEKQGVMLKSKKGLLKVDSPPMSEAKPGGKKKNKTKNGEMPSWMRSFVMSNNLVVADDVKLENEKKKK